MPLILDPNTGEPVMIPDGPGAGPAGPPMPPMGPPGGGMPPGMPPGMGPGGPPMPPEAMMGLLGPGGGPTPPPGLMEPPMGEEAGPGGTPPDSSQDMSPEDHLREAIEHAQQALVGEEDDPTSGELSKAISSLYRIFAQRQKEDEAALGVTPAHKGMARAYGKTQGGPTMGPSEGY